MSEKTALSHAEGHFTTRYKSLPLLHRHSQVGVKMQWDSDPFSLGRMRSVADRDEFPSIAAANDIPSAPNEHPPTYCMRFCQVPGAEEVLAIANEDGRVAFHHTDLARRVSRAGTVKRPMEGHSLHKNAIYDFAWPDGDASVIATVSGDQSARVWSVAPDGSGMRRTNVLRGHTRSVKAVQFRPDDNNVLATGSRDNTVRVWDLRIRSDVVVGDTAAENVVRNAHAVKSASVKSCSSSVTDIAFADANSLISCGDNDGVVKVWDMRRTYSVFKNDPVPKYRFLHPGDSTRTGYTSMRIDSERKFLYVGCMDNKIYAYNLASLDERPARAFVGCDSSSFFVRISLSPDGQYLASGSGDKGVYIWNVDATRDSSADVNPVCCLTGHDVEVTCVDWCKVGWRIASCGDDMKHRLWEMDPGIENNGSASNESGREYYVGQAEMKPFEYRSVGRSYRPMQRGGVLRAPERFRETKGIELESRLARFTKFDSILLRVKKFGESYFRRGKRKLTRDTSPTSSKLVSTPDIKSFLKKRPRHPVSAKDEQSSSSAAGKKPRLLSPEEMRKVLRDLPCTPHKMNVTEDKKNASPKKLSFSSSPTKKMPESALAAKRLKLDDVTLLRSPTANLPNLVVDGRSPLQRPVVSSPRRPSTDWLTSLSRQKKQTVSEAVKENVSTTSPRTPRSTKRSASVVGRGPARAAKTKKK